MTNRISIKFVSKIFFIIFFVALPSSIYPSDLIIKVTGYFANKHGTESLSPEHEQFVRDIINEMGITQPLYIRKMNIKAMRYFGVNNAFAYCGNFIFIGESFFKELTPLEQRFLIGHELAHIKFNHPYKLLFNSYFLIALAASVSLTVYKTMTYQNFDSLPSWISSVFSGIIIANLIGPLFSAIGRSYELEADYESAFRLNNLEGALAFLKRQGKVNMYDYSKFINRLRATHPSYPERIAALENNIIIS